MAIEIDVNFCGKRTLYAVWKAKNRYLKLLKSSKLLKWVWLSNNKLKEPFFYTLFKKYIY